MQQKTAQTAAVGNQQQAQKYRRDCQLRPENDEYKLVFIQVLDDFIDEYRKDDIVAAI